MYSIQIPIDLHQVLSAFLPQYFSYIIFRLTVSTAQYIPGKSVRVSIRHPISNNTIIQHHWIENTIPKSYWFRFQHAYQRLEFMGMLQHWDKCKWNACKMCGQLRDIMYSTDHVYDIHIHCGGSVSSVSLWEIG